MRRHTSAVVAAVWMLLGSSTLNAQERQTISTAAPVAIYNLAGEVNVVQGSGNDVVVEIRRGGADSKELRIATGVIDGRNTLRVIYPGDNIDRKSVV